MERTMPHSGTEDIEHIIIDSRNRARVATNEEIIAFIKQQFNLHNNLYADFRLVTLLRYSTQIVDIPIEGEGKVCAEITRIEEMIPYVVETEFGCKYQVFPQMQYDNMHLIVSLIKCSDVNTVLK